MLDQITCKAYGKQWIVGSGGKVICELDTNSAQRLVNDLSAWLAENKEPCGECHLQPNETCDICGAFQPE